VAASSSKSNGGKKMVKHFPAHAIIRVDGRWGVLCIAFGYDVRNRGERVVDFWDGGLERVDGDALAEGLPIE
jgi:hypothetical protein